MMPARIGSYPLERELGRGGMGIVYLARDARLGRPVAIKVLPDGFADDPDRLARFEREARLLASLTHPNVAGIYGLEEADGRRFLALEYVAGETLAQRLQRGPLPLDETLEVCRQIACALEAAHEAGIVHRDLKPGNVKLTESGEVKVLDFGLAKSSSGATDSNPDLSHSPTVTRAATGMGVILGTAAYMSPEQARGRPVDRRTDIWSFGCVLYECLTGEQAFAGETVSDMIARILQGEPDASRLPEKTPARLRQLLARCLEKDAKRRLRDIGEARIEIEELQGARASGTSGLRSELAIPAVGPEPRSRNRWRAIAAGAALFGIGAAAGVGAWKLAGPGPADRQPLRFTVAAPPGRELHPDPNEHPISPDGRTIILTVTDSTGNQSLWLRPLASFEARELPGTRGAELPFWSPDGRQIAFFADAKLKRVGLDGGGVEIVCAAPGARGGAWSRKGVIVFAPVATGPLMQVRASGGTPEPVTAVDSTNGETAHRWPSFLPDGERFLYASLPAKGGQFTTWLGSLRSRRRTQVVSASSGAVYSPSGHVVFNRGGSLVAQRFDGRRLHGDPTAIGSGISQTFYSASPGVSVSRNGVLAWKSAGRRNMRLVWLDRSGRELERLDVPEDQWQGPNVSPDGRRAVVMRATDNDDVDIWMVDVERGIANRLTYGIGSNTSPIWSPDGREIAYASTREGPRNIYRRNADGSGADRLLYQSSKPFKNPDAWSRDGRWLLFEELGDASGWNLMMLPLEGGPVRPYLASPFNEQNGDLSPDGRWAMYISDESGLGQVYVQSFPEPGSKQQVTKTGALFGQWSRDGREIVVLRPDFAFVSIPVTLGAELRVGTPREMFRVSSNAGGGFMTPDGTRFLFAMPAETAPAQVSVAMHWSDALK